MSFETRIGEDTQTGSTRKECLLAAMRATRDRTLELFARIPDELLNLRVHDFYSPVGWHFGHIGMTEEFWALTRALGRAPRDADYSFLFANLPENPKDNRVHLPSRDAIVGYLVATRREAMQALEELDLNSDTVRSDPLLADGYAWDFAHQHECQHQETICELLQLLAMHTHREAIPQRSGAYEPIVSQAPGPTVRISGGTFWMGSDDPNGYDNEKRAHEVALSSFEMERYPVSVAQWLAFMEDGGYRWKGFWSEAGWAWREVEGISMPEYWCRVGASPSPPISAKERGAGAGRGWESARYGYYGAEGLRPLLPNEPVCGISWYEADAYARWAGRRLPTEVEWEFVARYDSATHQTHLYPWGDTTPTPELACYGMERFGKPILHPTLYPSGNAVNGLSGVLGGAWEWTGSPFMPYPGFEAYPYDGYSKDHMDGKHFCCRGGSWATDGRILRSSFRNWYVPTYRQGFLGLRCVL